MFCVSVGLIKYKSGILASSVLSSCISRRAATLAVMVFAALSAIPHAIAQTTQYAQLNQLSDVKTRGCDAEEIQLFKSSSGASLLSVYGYADRLPWTCSSASISWLSSAKIVQLHATAAPDLVETVTLVRAAPGERLWLIPTINGTATYSGVWNEPHSHAVLNDLIRVANLKPSSVQQWTQLALFYLYITGMQVHLADYEVGGERRKGLRSYASDLKKDDLLPEIEPEKQGTLVSIVQFINDESYYVWDLNFTMINDVPRLASVTREQRYKVGD